MYRSKSGRTLTLWDAKENTGTNRGLALRLKVALFAGTALPVLLLVLATLAFAQDQADPNQQGSVLTSQRVPDILVTANMRAEASQNTPVAVSVMGAQEIERAEIRDLLDLRLHWPRPARSMAHPTSPALTG